MEAEDKQIQMRMKQRSTVSFARRWLNNLPEPTSKKTGSSFVAFQYKTSAFMKGVLLPDIYTLPDYSVLGVIHMQIKCKIKYDAL